MNKDAIIYEPWAKGMIHNQFLKCFIIMISEIYDNVVFYGENELIDNIYTNLKLKNVTYKKIKIVDCESFSGKLSCLLIEFLNVLRLQCKKGNYDIYVTCGIPYTMFWCRKLLKNTPIFFIMHGGLEFLEKKISPLKLYYYIKSELLKLSDKHNLILLGESIKNNLLLNFPSLNKKAISIDHPYLPLASFSAKDKTDEVGLIKIGSVGIATYEKGSNSLIEIITFLNDKKITNIEVSHVGRVSNELKVLTNYIRIPFQTNEMIPSHDFNKELEKLDYFLYLYPSDNYKYTASGALLDALVHGKPIIALKNDYFNYFFSKYTGIGFLFDSVQDLCEGLTKLPSTNSNEYNFMVENEIKTLESLSPLVVKNDLLKGLKYTSCHDSTI